MKYKKLGKLPLETISMISESLSKNSFTNLINH